MLIDGVAPDWYDICWATQLSRNRIVRVCLTSFFFIDRSIYRIRWAEIDVTKSRAFYCNPTIFSVGAKLFSFIWFLFSFFFFHLWRTKQEGEYVLEKQVNGQGVSPYDPSHNSTAVLVGKPNLWFVISQWTADEIRDIYFFIFVSTCMWPDVCNFHRRS